MSNFPAVRSSQLASDGGGEKEPESHPDIVAGSEESIGKDVYQAIRKQGKLKEKVALPASRRTWHSETREKREKGRERISIPITR